MIDWIVTILTSSVISSVVVVISNIFLNQKKNSLEYITNERSIWRKEVREIAEEIERADEDSIHVPLAKLKVRINAYDKFTQNKIDIGDSCIWKLIEICENNHDPQLFKKLKDSLIISISLMLKYDWEKSKQEVSFDRNSLGCTICVIVQIITYLGLYYFLELDLETSLLLSAAYIILLILLNAFLKIMDYREIVYIKWSEKINQFSMHFVFVIASAIFTLLIILSNDAIFINSIEINCCQKIMLSITILFPTWVYFILGIEKKIISKYRIYYVQSFEKLIKNILKDVKKEK